MSRRIVSIAGCGAVSDLGAGVGLIRAAILNNTSGLTRRTRTINKLAQEFVVGCVPTETETALAKADPAHSGSRICLIANAAAREAIANTGPLFNEIAPERRGLVLATTKANIGALKAMSDGQPSTPLALRHIHPALLAEDLAESIETRGPVQCVSSACISGLLALQQGVRLISRRAADLVVVVGADLVSDFVLTGFTSLKSLDPAGCRPFDKARNGLSLGEGAGAIVLARSDLVSRPHALLCESASSNDANHLTGPSRDGAGLALAISRALAKAEASADSIDYINAHGTGTPYNDQTESLALRAVFGDRVPPFSSSKGLFGHSLGAAGILETILCVEAMRTSHFPGTPRLEEPDPLAPPSLVKQPKAAGTIRRVLKINCGFGGANAAVVLEKGVA